MLLLMTGALSAIMMPVRGLILAFLRTLLQAIANT
jgi:hypothetical protein